MSQRKSRPTLLERAIAAGERAKYQKATPTREEIDVAVAWIRDEITLSQVAAAFYPDQPAKGVTGRALYRVAHCLRAAYQQGQIQVAA